MLTSDIVQADVRLYNTGTALALAMSLIDMFVSRVRNSDLQTHGWTIPKNTKRTYEAIDRKTGKPARLWKLRGANPAQATMSIMTGIAIAYSIAIASKALQYAAVNDRTAGPISVAKGRHADLVIVIVSWVLPIWMYLFFLNRVKKTESARVTVELSKLLPAPAATSPSTITPTPRDSKIGQYIKRLLQVASARLVDWHLTLIGLIIFLWWFGSYVVATFNVNTLFIGGG